MTYVNSIVVGGGIAGLTLSNVLAKQKKDFFWMESSHRLGGKIESLRTKEALFEFGPNSFANQAEEIFELIDSLGLTPKIIEASPKAKKRYILRDGRIRKLPGNPFEILTTKSVSFSGKLRFLREIFYVPKKKSRDESVYEFFERHFGSEVADYFADPFVTGIYAGDAKKLSIKGAFPSMHEAEKKSSSLIRHLIQKRKSSRASPKTFQLEGGLETLFKNCDRILGKGRVHLSEPVTNIKRSSSGYNVQTEKKTYYAENVYLSSPAYIAAEILRASFPDLSKALNKIEYAPVISAHVKISKIEKMQFNGYGILIPSSEKRNILGVLWNSSTFPTQFQDKEHHYMTVFVGGVLNRAMMDLSEAKLKESIADELINLFNLKSKPELLHIRRHERAIPQFNLGYGEILKSIHLELEKYSGLQLAGNYMGGLSIAKTVTQAMNLVG